MLGSKGRGRAWIILVVFTVVALAILVTACVQGEKASGKIGVAVTILPQAEFVERVGGDKVEVTVMIPPGASPHTYEPIPSQIGALSRAKMYAQVGSGLQFELVWMNKLIAANKKMLVADCSQGIELKETTMGHSEESGMDPHTWMSPLNAKIMVQRICDGLAQVDPDNRAYYERNHDTYLQELTKLDEDIKGALAGVTDRNFMVYHPAFGYFAQAYNLTMFAIEEEGKEPSAADIARLIEQAKERNITVIFAAPQFNPQSARVIAAAIGGRVVFIDHLAKDYIANMRALVAELAEAMK